MVCSDCGGENCKKNSRKCPGKPGKKPSTKSLPQELDAKETQE